MKRCRDELFKFKSSLGQKIATDMLRWRGGSRGGLVIGILLNKVKEVHVFIHLL